MREITKIQSKVTELPKRKKVAAYARVSSGKDAMLHSLSAQISYYNDYISSRNDWEFVGVYADSGITGTKESRPEFMRMCSDCKAGKIDMVITKSITRFARNTVTLLSTVRELKELGIDVYFEKERIHTLSSDGELMITLLASYAQEESRSASENQKWKIRKRFEQGIPNTGRMLGYRLKNGKLEIIPEEAEIVKQIFADYLSGMGLYRIKKKLYGNNVPTMLGGTWSENIIKQMLINEKYTGDMLLQKTYIENHITKRTKINNGVLPKYQVIGSHEAIIDKETFDAVQKEMERRRIKSNATNHKPESPFTSLIKCSLCGKYYHRKSGNAGTKYAKPIWICATFNMWGKEYCASQQIPEKILIAKTKEVLHLETLEGVDLRKYISQIAVPEHNHLIFVFNDGHTVDIKWQNPSRSKSWTEEMKQKAREKTLKQIAERRSKNGNK